jgi:excinuclease ABC subunit B
MLNAVKETNRRREIQQKYNEDHNITPHSIKKEIRGVIDTYEELSKDEELGEDLRKIINENKLDGISTGARIKLIAKLEKDMKQAAKDLNFEQAAQLRDLMISLKMSK